MHVRKYHSSPEPVFLQQGQGSLSELKFIIIAFKLIQDQALWIITKVESLRNKLTAKTQWQNRAEDRAAAPVDGSKKTYKLAVCLTLGSGVKFSMCVDLGVKGSLETLTCFLIPADLVRTAHWAVQGCPNMQVIKMTKILLALTPQYMESREWGHIRYKLL